MDGGVIVESVFARPALGEQRRGNKMQIHGTVLVVASVYVPVTPVVDLVYAAFDPRIRHR
jgi:ABC-type dipeptide/oligopeptide/nickel transport system permease component